MKAKTNARKQANNGQSKSLDRLADYNSEVTMQRVDEFTAALGRAGMWNVLILELSDLEIRSLEAAAALRGVSSAECARLWVLSGVEADMSCIAEKLNETKAELEGGKQ